ncbi:hypothetical protein V1477_013895 [Vespula maculifrons]|uniref:Uncharacterized protein n=1 Tax=Vespula maculifrons TaxID=7453 RepID=A0ABD2BR17_VESMC
MITLRITAFMLCVEESDKAALESSLTATYKTLDSIVVYSESVEIVAVTLTPITARVPARILAIIITNGTALRIILIYVKNKI